MEIGGVLILFNFLEEVITVLTHQRKSPLISSSMIFHYKVAIDHKQADQDFVLMIRSLILLLIVFLSEG